MKKHKRYYLLLLLIICISIGFAYLSANLDVMGIANIRRVKWNIYFDNVKNISGDKFLVTPPTTTGTNTTSIDFKVQLEDPGDSYSFNVDVINDGTVDAMVNLITKSSLDATSSKLFSFDITYSDGTSIEAKNFLGSGRSDTLTVNVTYNRNIDIADLPSADKEISFNIQLEYQQAKDADDRENTNATIVKDLSGNANHGKIVGAKKTGNGTISTNGTSSYVFCGLKNYQFPNGLSYVVRFTLLKNSNGSIFGNADSGGVDLEISGGKLLSRTYADGKYVDAIGSVDMTVDNIFHTVVVVTTNTETTLYLDGVSIGNLTISNPVLSVPASFALGANMNFHDDQVGSFLSIEVSDVLLFERQLSVDEITSNYSNKVTLGDKSGLLLYYNFE